MTQEAFKELLDGFQADTLSTEQRKTLADLLHSPERRKELENLFDQEPDTSGGVDPEILQLVYQQVRLNMDQPARVRRLLPRRNYVVAAVIAGLLTLTGFWLLLNKKKEARNLAIANVYKNDVSPGGNHAVLTLANGARILLDSAGNGNLVKQGSAQVVKVVPGKLTYRPGVGGTNVTVYNTVTTPAGGEYEITLGDGTKVWLNALSSLKFPTTFDGPDRTVDLTGEAYFDVAKNIGKPFHVRVNGIEVDVLGTEFDVNSYADETSIKTSLVQGSVRLQRGGTTMVLKSGEQGQTTGADGLALVKDADLDAAVAWKKGYFSFEDANVQTVMRELSRWYGIEIRYEVNPAAGSFGGEMGRDLKLTQVLDGLSKSGVHFRLEQKVLTVLP
jgi:ferric-dicitrate binding protein FerR (iron transport regulator)